MSSILIQKARYKALTSFIDENLAKIATLYDESTVCLQDQNVISTIKTTSSIVYSLLNVVGDAKKRSSIYGYSDTESVLSKLYKIIQDLLSTLDELSKNIDTKSRKNHDELLEAGTNIKLAYEAYCVLVSTNIETYNNLSDKYNSLKNMINNTDKTDPGYSALYRQYQEIPNQMNTISDVIERCLKQLNDEIKTPLEQLLEDGLQKSNTTVIGGTNPSVVLSNNGTSASLY